MANSDHSDRSRRERIARLKQRVGAADILVRPAELIAIIKGILDLLADEL